jgi:hypothetical protein
VQANGLFERWAECFGCWFLEGKNEAAGAAVAAVLAGDQFLGRDAEN